MLLWSNPRDILSEKSSVMNMKEKGMIEIGKYKYIHRYTKHIYTYCSCFSKKKSKGRLQKKNINDYL